jgi:DNA-binding MarR family transcriptional regulator
VDLDSDPVLLFQACSAALGDRVLAAVRDEVGEDLRFGDGYLFQHLIPGPTTASELGRKLGVTQQAASLQIADLERRKLVRRSASGADARARPVELTDRGWRAIEVARSARLAIAQELEDVLGTRNARQLTSLLQKVSEQTGAMETMAARRLRPESER